MNYTKGDWTVTKHPPLDNYVVVLLGDKPHNDSGICQVDYLSDKKEALANANLIAAAPLLYEALKAADSFLIEIAHLWGEHPYWEKGEPTHRNIAKALAKAEGKNAK